MLYELVTARRPFSCRTPTGVCEEIQRRYPKPPRQIDDSIPRALERIGLRCLSKDVSGRYATAADLADELSVAVGSSQTSFNPATEMPTMKKSGQFGASAYVGNLGCMMSLTLMCLFVVTNVVFMPQTPAMKTHTPAPRSGGAFDAMPLAAPGPAPNAGDDPSKIAGSSGDSDARMQLERLKAQKKMQAELRKQKVLFEPLEEPSLQAQVKPVPPKEK